MPGAELIGNEELQQIQEVINNKTLFRYNKGYKVKEFEGRCNEFLEVKHSLAVSSGSAAVYLALIGCGVKPGDEVIMPRFTFVATEEAVRLTGATPVYADIDYSLTMDPISAENLISDKTTAIVPVHMMGTSCDMDSICGLAQENNMSVIEDACQAFGAKYKGMRCGSMGDAGAFSFAFTKVITTGEGGLVTTHFDSIATKVSQYHDHGHVHEEGVYRGKDARNGIGFNLRMDEMSGAVGIAQLARIQYIIDKQKENKSYIIQKLRDTMIGYREHYDVDGEIGDTLVMRFPNPKSASAFADSLQEKKLFQKILPCALDWHYLDKRGFRTRDVLASHVAIPINLNMDLDFTVDCLLNAYEVTKCLM